MGQARTFGLLLRQRRNQTGLSLQELGLAVGMSKDHLSRIERGLVTPPDSVLDQLATTLAVPRPDFYKAAGRRPPSSGQPADAVDAIMADPILSEQEKAYLVHGLIPAPLAACTASRSRPARPASARTPTPARWLRAASCPA